MSDLATIQRTLADAIRGDHPVSEHVARYREQFFLRHVGVLEEDFASVLHAAGRDDFRALVRRYLIAHPPTSFTLRDLGQAFPAFLEDPFLRDLARVEWAFVEAFDGPDAGPLNPSALAGIPEDAWPGARIAIHPSLQRLSLEWPAHLYRHAVRTGAEPSTALRAVWPRSESPPSAGPRSKPSAKPTFVVIARGPNGLAHTEVEPLAFALLDAIAHGATLEEACARVVPPREEIAGWFRRWTESGWISAIYFPPSFV